MLGQDEGRRGIARNVAESVRSRFGYQHWLSCLRARLKGSDGSFAHHRELALAHLDRRHRLVNCGA